MTNKLFATGLQVIGLGSVTIGVFLWSIPAGLVVAGAVALLIGFSLGIDK